MYTGGNEHAQTSPTLHTVIMQVHTNKDELALQLKVLTKSIILVILKIVCSSRCISSHEYDGAEF